MTYAIAQRRMLSAGDAEAVATPPAGIGTPTSIGFKSDATGVATRQITSVTVPAGALIVVLLVDSEGVEIPTVGAPVADSAGNTYVAGTQFNNGASSNNLRAKFFYCENATAMTGGSITGTFLTSDAVLKTIHAAYVTGVKLSGSADIEVSAKNTSASPSVATGTLAQAAEVIFAACTVEGGSSTSLTEDAGFTNLSQTAVSDTINLAAKVVSATTSVTYAPTLGASRHWGAAVKSFKGA